MPMDKPFRILVVDDEPDICEILSFNLAKAGYVTSMAYSAEEVLQGNPAGYDLILLDVMMGAMSGFQLAAVLKKNPATSRIPIIFLTAKDSENDTVSGLELGADDYITKPFSIREVLARIQAVLRRTNAELPPEAELVFEGLRVIIPQKAVIVDGTPAQLTRIEFELLCLLLSHKGKVFSRAELIEAVWPGDVVVLDRTVDVNITRIRKKIGKYAGCLRTRSGYGYYFAE